jgi:glycosidase
MPDMNYRNPAVRAQIKEEAKFWIDKGIDGFRLDGADNIDLDDDVEIGWWKEFSSFVNTTNPDVFVVGEITFPGNYEK